MHGPSSSYLTMQFIWSLIKMVKKIPMTFQYTVVHVRVQTYVIQMFQRNWMHAHLTGLSV